MPPFFPPTDRVGVKICGITTAEQGRAIAALGADALGVNFWARSKRFIDPAEASAWLPELRSLTSVIAVLVNPDQALLDRLAAEPIVHQVQLHGDESPAMVEALMARGLDVIKALQVRNRESLNALGDYPCRTLLLDAHNPGSYGGGGITFPWELFLTARALHPDKTLILSGGLTPTNVAEAVRLTRPAAVDVASGVERTPGIKDLEQVAAFIQATRAAST